MGDEGVHHAVFERLFRSQRFSSEDDIERFRQVYQARQARGATPRWNKSDLSFRQTDARGAVLRSDAPIAGQANFEAAADARAVNRRHGRQWQRRDAVEDGLAELNQFAQSGRVRFGGDRVQVGARYEYGFLGAAQDQSPQFRMTTDEIEVRVQFVQCRAVENIRGRTGTVEGQDADLFGGDFAPDVRRGGLAGSGRCRVPVASHHRCFPRIRWRRRASRAGSQFVCHV